jgi:hypothetical protein
MKDLTRLINQKTYRFPKADGKDKELLHLRRKRMEGINAMLFTLAPDIQDTTSLVEINGCHQQP